MEEQRGPLSREYCYREEGNEELRCSALYTLGLETTVTAKEELARRDFELISIKDVLFRSVEKKDEAQTECQKPMLENLLLQQQQQQTQETAAMLSGISRSEDESKTAETQTYFSSPTDSNKDIVPSSFTEPNPQQSIPQALPKAALNLAAERPLPEKGKLLKAVMEAGPLLQTLLLAGPLPQWQHPPPRLDSIEIPPVAISSPSPRFSQQASLNSINGGSARKGVGSVK